MCMAGVDENLVRGPRAPQFYKTLFQSLSLHLSGRFPEADLPENTPAVKMSWWFPSPTSEFRSDIVVTGMHNNMFIWIDTEVWFDQLVWWGRLVCQLGYMMGIFHQQNSKSVSSKFWQKYMLIGWWRKITLFKKLHCERSFSQLFVSILDWARWL